MKNKVVSVLDKTFADPKARKELLEMLYNSLTSTVGKVSSSEYFAKVDLMGNFLYEMVGFSDSLKNAVVAILENHSNEDENSCDGDLNKLVELCDAIKYGSDISRQYLDSMKAFGDDLETIKKEINYSLVNIHGEIA